MLTGSVQGGYDDDLATQLAGPVEDVAVSGYATFSDLGLRYTFTGGSSSLDVEGRGYLITYPDSEIRRSLGGDATVRATTSVGRTQFSGGGSVRYTPYYSLEAFQGLTTAAEVSSLPESSPVNGIPDDQSVIREAFGGLTRQWGARHGTTAQVTRVERDRQGEFGSDYNSWDAQLAHTYLLSRSLSLAGSYTLARARFEQLGTAASAGDMDTHSAEFSGFRTIRVSPSRSIVIGGGAGADRVSGVLSSGVPYAYWAPTGRASSQFDIGRNWSVLADYRRTVVPLDGVSGQSFPSNVFFLNAGGPLWGRMSTAVTGGYAGGRAGAAEATGNFRTYNLSTQLDFAISQHWMVNATYNLYDYRIGGQQGEPGEIPGSLRRGTIRVGLSAALPLTRTTRTLPVGPANR